MKSISFDDYEARPPVRHPANDQLIILAFISDDTEMYVFPMNEEQAEAYYEALGEALGKNKPRIYQPTAQEVKHASRTR
jgi:cytochrome b involved in lipid metabolism